jgi:Fe-Mn family superoxide dismutase
MPILVMDMYEHSLHLDYGAAAARHVDAFFESVNWNKVNQQPERAQEAAAALGRLHSV